MANKNHVLRSLYRTFITYLRLRHRSFKLWYYQRMYDWSVDSDNHTRTKIWMKRLQDAGGWNDPPSPRSRKNHK